MAYFHGHQTIYNELLRFHIPPQRNTVAGQPLWALERVYYTLVSTSQYVLGDEK